MSSNTGRLRQYEREVDPDQRLDPVERERRAAQMRSQNTRRAALIRWSREDPQQNARRANAGLVAKFEREVDPDQTLDPAERERRARCALRAHMIEIRQIRARSSDGT